MGSRGGFTLIEMAVALVLMSVLGGLVFLTAESTSNAVNTGVAVAELDGRALRVLERVCDALKASSAGVATPQAETPFSNANLDFRRGLGADADGDVLWGPLERLVLEYDEADDGLDDDGDGLVDEGRLVWIEDPGGASERRVVLCQDVREYLAGETLDGDDQNQNGLLDERGFALDFTGNRVTVRLTLEGRDRDGRLLASTVQRSVVFRNQGN